jgi:hypothetical protein
MFIMVEIGFFGLCVIIVIVIKLLQRQTQQENPLPQAEASYRSEYAELSFKGSDPKLLDDIHSREIILRETQIQNEYSLRLAQMNANYALKTLQFGLLASIVFMYLVTRLWWMRKGKI